MKMTSKGTLLVVAGVIGLGCSSPADDDGGMQDPPVGRPPYIDQPQTQAPATNTNTNTNTNVNPLQPAPNTEVTPNPTVNPTPGAAGSGSGSGGAGNAPAASTIPRGMPGTGFNLTPVAGWVAGGTNEAGIQGAFSTISDAANMPAGSTTIMPPSNFQMAMGSQICVSGTASQVIGTAYGQYWGGGVALDLGDPGQMLPKVPWSRGNVVGFSFNITGTTIPPMGQFRFGVAPYEGSTINDNGPCANITMGANTIMLSQLRTACYDAAPGAALPATASLATLKWQVATVTTATTPFNFCIENLRAITQ